MTDNTKYLARTPIWRSLMHLCIPMIAGFSVGTVYNIINAGFIGSLHETSLLAALTFSLPVFAIIMAFGGVFGVGGGTYISRLLGMLGLGEDAGEEGSITLPPGTTPKQRIRQASSFTLWGAVAAGVVLGVVGLVFATPIAGLLGASGDALVPTAVYIGAMFAFTPVYAAMFALEQVVRAEGAANASMMGLIISTVVNLILDVVFILILHWGVLGAGLAVGLSNVAAVLYYAWFLTRRSQHMSVSLKDFRMDADMLKTVFGVGVSELLQSSFLVVTTIVMNWIAIGYGEALLASMGVALRISQLPEMIGMGIFMGAIPLFAYTMGARDMNRLRRGILGVAVAIAGVTVVFSGIVFLFRDQVFTLFSADPAVIEDGTRILTAMLVATLFNGFTGLIIAVFQATGQMRNATIMAVAQGALFIPVVFAAQALWGMTGVIWAMTMTELICFVVGLALFTGTWKSFRAMNVTASPAEQVTPEA